MAGPNGPLSRFEGPIGLDGTFREREAQGNGPLLAVKGSWSSDDTFQIVVRSLLEGTVATYALTFDAQHVEVSFEDNRGVRARFQGDVSD